MRKLLILSLSLSVLLTGCGTLVDTFSSGPRIYGGVQWDFELPDAYESNVLLIIFMIFDVPLSAVLDTAFLPFTVPYQLLRGGGEADTRVRPD